MKGKLVQLEVVDLAFDGKAVAYLDGKVVFLDGGLPGETVTAELTRIKPRFDEAAVRQIVTPSESRVSPRCSHFGYCGGCAWQDLRYEEQLRYKKGHVIECLRRIGGLEAVEVADVLAAPTAFFYRNKMEYSFHVTGADEFSLGLHRRGRFDQVFDLEACYLQSETSNGIVHWVRRFVRDERLSAYDVNSCIGLMRFLVIRQARRTRQVMVIIITSADELPGCDRLVAGLTGEFPEIATIIHGRNDQKSNVAVAQVEIPLYGPGYIEEELLGLRFRIRANSFFQSNTEQAERLYQHGFDLLQPQASDRLLDLYCGTGTIGLLLARQVAEVVGVETVPEAVQMAGENAQGNGIANARFVCAQVRGFLKALPAGEPPFDAVVVDPPRAGLHPKSLRRLAAMKPPRLLYISCNPATFARDARELVAAGYAISPVQPVDMFPHTRHVELAALFRI